MALPHGISPSQLDDVLYDLAARVLEDEAAAACAQLTQVERDVKGSCGQTRISSLSISAVRIDSSHHSHMPLLHIFLLTNVRA